MRKCANLLVSPKVICFYAVQNTRRLSGLSHNTFFRNNHYTKYIDHEEVKLMDITSCSTLQAMNADVLFSSLKYVYYLANVSKMIRRCYSGSGVTNPGYIYA